MQPSDKCNPSTGIDCPICKGQKHQNPFISAEGKHYYKHVSHCIEDTVSKKLSDNYGQSDYLHEEFPKVLIKLATELNERSQREEPTTKQYINAPQNTGTQINLAINGNDNDVTVPQSLDGNNISDTVVQTQEKEEKDDENMTFCQKFKKGVKKCLCRFCGICLGECCC